MINLDQHFIPYQFETDFNQLKILNTNFLRLFREQKDYRSSLLKLLMLTEK